MEKNTDIPDKIKNSIILYNKALESLRLDSEDIAIIELRKAVSMNPNFCEAVNLLGLCYYYIKDFAKASEMFSKVISVENNSVKALEYMKVLDSDNGSPASASRVRKNVRVEKKDNSEGGKFSLIKGVKISGKRDIIKYVIGFAAGALLIFLLSLTNTHAKNTKEPDNVENNTNQVSEEVDLYKSKLNKLDKDYKTVKKDLEAANESVDYYKSVIKLYEIDDLVAKKNYEAAADMLILMKTVEFRGQEKEKFDRLYNEVLPAAAKSVFDEGMTLFTSKKLYQEALKMLNKVELYSSSFESMDAVLYYTGKCYQQMDDSRNAIAVYQKLMDRYPESKYFKYAGFRIKELTGNP